MGMLCWASKGPLGYSTLVERSFLLQFADDSVALATSPEKLQNMINVMTAHYGDCDNDNEEISSDDTDDHVNTCENNDE